jgi:hypothetical protein
MLTPEQVNNYIADVVDCNMVDEEIDRIQEHMIEQTKNPVPEKNRQKERMKNLTLLFQALLKAKSEQPRKEVIQEVCDNNSSSPENSSTRPAHDPARSKGVWNILKEKITGSGQ